MPEEKGMGSEVLNGKLRKTIEQGAKAKIRLLDVLSAQGMEISSLRVCTGLSKDGLLLEVLVYVPLRRQQPAVRAEHKSA